MQADSTHDSVGLVGPEAPRAYNRAVAAKTNLHRSLKVFVGRERELERVKDLFDAGERLVSLVGPAGIGKTRVALRFMERNLRDYEDAGGAWFCDFTESETVDDICREVSRALQAWHPGSHGAETIAGLGDTLATHERLLLVLDNCEQIADHITAMLDRWLASAPEARFLITSRERLRVPGETAIELGPLPLPDSGETAMAAVAASEATQLFLDRARRVAADFELSADNAGTVAEIVRRLDGMPLAIELAAARVGVLRRPTDLLERLSERFNLLASHARGVPDRHRTLRAAIDWSWELLEEWERAGLAQLSVFRGGFSIAAADEVVRVQMYPNPPDVIGGLQWLRDKSLVWAGGGDDNRFGLYLSVRDYAAEKLQALELEDQTFARHAEYYREQVAPLIDAPVTTAAVAMLTREEENLLAAFNRSLGGDAERLRNGVVCLLALEPLRATRGPWDEYATRMTRAIEAPAFAELEPVLAARIYHARGRMIGLRGRLQESTRDFDAALAYARKAGDKRLEGNVLLRLGVLANNVNDFDRAREHYQAALPLLRQVGDRYTEGQALANLAVVDGQLGRYDDARRGFEAAQILYAAVGARQLQARTTGNLGTILQDEGELDEALLHFDRAIAELNDIGNRRDAAVFVGAKGTLYQERGDMDRAEAHLTEAVEALRGIGDDPFEGLFLGYLATVAASRDDLRTASEMLAEVENRWRVAPMGPGADDTTLVLLKAHVELGLARKAEAEGDIEGAERRRHAVREQLRAASPVDDLAPPQRVRIAMRILRRALSDGAVEDAGGGSTLSVGSEGRWFSLPGGDNVDLYKRHTLRRILWRLVEHQRTSPGKGLELDDLFRAGWPDERVVRTAAANRVRVAVTTLRKLGLRDVLLTHSDGYLIDPACRVVVRED